MIAGNHISGSGTIIFSPAVNTEVKQVRVYVTSIGPTGISLTYIATPLSKENLIELGLVTLNQGESVDFIDPGCSITVNAGDTLKVECSDSCEIFIN